MNQHERSHDCICEPTASADDALSKRDIKGIHALNVFFLHQRPRLAKSFRLIHLMFLYVQ